MGRPLNKRHFGSLSNENPDKSIKCNFHDGTAIRQDRVILKQVSRNKYACKNNTTGTNTAITSVEAEITAGTAFVCTNVDVATGSLTSGQMNIIGVTGGGTAVRVKRLTAHYAYDWSDNRYTWVVDDDSTSTQLTLTAV
jgi:hypothetical protein